MPDESNEPPPPVLELANVSLAAGVAGDIGLREVNLRLNAGELALVKLDSELLHPPLADVACGIVEPSEGVVRVAGHDWQRMGFRESARQRGRIGRVFDGVAWIANLDVDENVVLASRHHGHASDTELARSADDLAKRLGLEHGLPRTRPQATTRGELSRAAVVRAVLSDPQLLLMERPEQGLSHAAQSVLAELVKEARQRGAAVLWLTTSHLTWTRDGLNPSQRLLCSGDRIRPEPAADRAQDSSRSGDRD